MEHANTQLKLMLLTWLRGEVAAEPKAPAAKLAAALLPPVVKCAEGADAGLREAALHLAAALALKARAGCAHRC